MEGGRKEAEEEVYCFNAIKRLTEAINVISCESRPLNSERTGITHILFTMYLCDTLSMVMMWSEMAVEIKMSKIISYCFQGLIGSHFLIAEFLEDAFEK